MSENILIFKTNIDAVGPQCGVSNALNALSGIESWTIDTEDCDRVLRVVGEVSIEDVVGLVMALGHECEELYFESKDE